MEGTSATPLPQEGFIPTFGQTYKVKFKNKSVAFTIKTKDKKFMEDKLKLFLSIRIFKPGFKAIKVFFNNQTIKGESIMTTTFKDADAKGKSALVTWGNPTDAAGNDAQVQDGSVKFTSSNPDVATVEADTSGTYVAKVSFTGKNGSTDITISADADLGDGDTEITGLSTFVIETTQATAFGTETVGALQ